MLNSEGSTRRQRSPMPGGRNSFGSKPGKYGPLGDYLSRLPSEQAMCELDFADVESLVGMPLPTSARTNWFWHKDEPASHARAWLEFGWRGELCAARRVRFVREAE